MISTASPPSPASIARQRLRLLGRSGRTPLGRAGLLAGLAGVLLIPQAAMIAAAIQRVFVERLPMASVRDVLLGLLLVGLLRAALAWRARQDADTAVERIRLELRRQLVRRLAARRPRWLRQQRSGELGELAGAHVDALEGYFGGFVPARTEVVIVPLAILIAVFWADRVVGAILLLTMPLVPFFMMLVGWGAEAASRQQLQALARMGGHFADRLRGLGLIRLYGRADSELAGIAAAAEGLRQRSLKVLRIAFLSSAVLEFFASISVAMVALYLGLTYLGMLDLRSDPLSLGTGVFCLLLAPEFYAPLRRLATHYHDRASALAATAEIDRMLTATESGRRTQDEQNEPATVRHSATTSASPPYVSVRGLALRPADAAHVVLHDLSFELGAGEHLALMGPSGGGKSTLLEALAGWLPAEAGTIVIAPETRIGYAPQRPFLFHGSLADNLRMAAPQASDAVLLRAAEAAQVMRFAARLPQGLDTRIGERGFGLSGGEARRVALARLFLRDPGLLLLDEPTAFLDPETEQAVLQAIFRFAQGRTLIVATHSPAVMRMAGCVLNVPDGRSSGTGARA